MRFVCIHDGEQRCGDEDSPKGPEHSEHNRREDRCPDWNLGRSPHNVRLEQQSIDNRDDGIEDQHTQRVLPIPPHKGSGEHGTEQAQNGTEVWHDLEYRRDGGPQWGEGEFLEIGTIAVLLVLPLQSIH